MCNNMELYINKCDYLFVFEVVDEIKIFCGKWVDVEVLFFCVVFDYLKLKVLMEGMISVDCVVVVNVFL